VELFDVEEPGDVEELLDVGVDACEAIEVDGARVGLDVDVVVGRVVVGRVVVGRVGVVVGVGAVVVDVGAVVAGGGVEIVTAGTVAGRTRM
jgi:hypothetical protein